MIDRDDELRRLLRTWEAPQPGPDLDRRIGNSFRQHREEGLLKRRGLRWMAMAAAVLLAVVGLHLWKAMAEGPRRAPNAETRLNAAGFQPLPDGAITVVKVKSEGKE